MPLPVHDGDSPLTLIHASRAGAAPPQERPSEEGRPVVAQATPESIADVGEPRGAERWRTFERGADGVQAAPPTSRRSIRSELFGRTAAGREVQRTTLTNASGAEVDVLTLGGVIQSIRVPDRSGRLANVALGCSSVEDYETRSPYFGALVGRCANRIGGGRFKLDGVEYVLAQNSGRNTIHGGAVGFDKHVWGSREVFSPRSVGLILEHTSPDGDEGFPGELRVRVLYTFSDDHELRIDYEAVTTRPTIVNLTNHSYFNLAGEGSGDVLGHEVSIDSDFITPINADLIPTGEWMRVDGTPLDLRTPKAVGLGLADPDAQLQVAGGYDHNWVLRELGHDEEVRRVATVHEPVSGRTLEVFTSAPGLQFYTGNNLDGSLRSPRGDGAGVYGPRAGLCLETQHFPNSPNTPSFPSVILRPGEAYRSTTIYRFGARPLSDF